MFRRTSSCLHFTSPPPTPPPPPSSGEDDKEPTRRPLPRCRLQLPPPTRPPARHAAAGSRIRPLPPLPLSGGWIRRRLRSLAFPSSPPGAGFSRASAAVLGAVAPWLGVRQRETPRSLPDLTPGIRCFLKVPVPGWIRFGQSRLCREGNSCRFLIPARSKGPRLAPGT